MFVALTDFQDKPMVIPSTDDVAVGLAAFIADQEETILIDLLGQHFYNEIKAGIEALPADWASTTAYVLNDLVVFGSAIYKALASTTNEQPDESPLVWAVQPDNRWLLLKEGDTFDDDGIRCFWNGMLQALRPAIYQEYLKFYVVNATGFGLAESATENSTIVPTDGLMSFMQNQFRRFSIILYDYLVSKEDDFVGDVTAAGYTTFLDYLVRNFIEPDKSNRFKL